MTKGDLLLLSLLGTLTAAVVFATVGWRTGLAIIGLTAAFWIGLAGWWYAVKRLAAACDDDMGEPQTPPDPRTK